MAVVSWSHVVDRSEAVVRRLLLDKGLLDAFVAEQKPTTQHVTVDVSAGLSRCEWTNDLAGNLPGLARTFVGSSLAVVFEIDLRAAELRMDARAKRLGKMRASLALVATTESSCTFGVQGTIGVSGAFGGMAETTVRDQVIIPVLQDDLVPLLNRWHDAT